MTPARTPAPAPERAPRLAKKARLRFDRHDARWMILYPERGLLLNETGAAIAKKLDGTRSLARVVEELAAEHESAARETVEADVLAFVADLEARGLLEP
jgi:coenzyme PQQ biosynthesis protein PqqD